jgi:hypothetical protein
MKTYLIICPNCHQKMYYRKICECLDGENECVFYDGKTWYHTKGAVIKARSVNYDTMKKYFSMKAFW